MSVELQDIDPEKVRIQLESAVQSHEMTVAGLLLDRQITEEAIAAVSQGEDELDAHYSHSLDQINRDIAFFTTKYETAKRKLAELKALD